MSNYPNPLVFVAWPKDFDGPGFAARSRYVEQCWCSVIGPTATMLVRTVACFLEDPSRRVSIPVDDLAAMLGVGRGGASNAVVPHTLARLERFGVAIGLPTGEMALRIVLPPLSAGQLGRAGRLVCLAHEQCMAAAFDGAVR